MPPYKYCQCGNIVYISMNEESYGQYICYKCKNFKELIK